MADKPTIKDMPTLRKFTAHTKCPKPVKRFMLTVSDIHARGEYRRLMIDAYRTYEENKKKRTKEKDTDE